MRPYGPYSVQETDAASYVLPDPLLTASGKRITTAAEWELFQRDAVLSLLKKYEYGEILPRPDGIEFELLSVRNDALQGRALRKEVKIHCTMNSGKSFSFIVLLYIPRDSKGPIPAFAGLNFKGNHNTTKESDVMPTGFLHPGILAEEQRGVQYERWIPDVLVERGYATASCCYHDLFPDRSDGGPDSVLRLWGEGDRAGEKYSVIGAWAWGLSRVLDYLESDSEIDASRVAVHGHSRLGKTALWAGAVDRRFRMVISNCSGCGGAALHRRKIGENFSQHFESHLQRGLPCWFSREAEKFIFREENFPVDQHELLAMIAPRPLVVASATRDLVADPRGEFLSALAASEVYRLWGGGGLPAQTMPPPDCLVSGIISYHCRTGVHDQTPQDWAHYLDLADRYLKKG